MKLREEMSHDLNFRQPRVIAVSAGKKFVTVRGSGFVIKEIFEGRLLIEGTIQGIEFFRTSGKDKD